MISLNWLGRLLWKVVGNFFFVKNCYFLFWYFWENNGFFVRWKMVFEMMGLFVFNLMVSEGEELYFSCDNCLIFGLKE